MSFINSDPEYQKKMKISLFSLREKRALRYIIFFVILTRILLAFRSEERIYTHPYTEDSFYLFSCAEHAAHGEGFTCDGKQPTNGVQPLIVILYVPLFLIAGANKLLALKLGFILIAIFDSFSTLFIAKLVRLLEKTPEEKIVFWKSPPVIAAMAWATLYPILMQTANGLETGLYSMMLLGTLYYYARLSRIRDEGKKASLLQLIIFGAILGLTVLARIDAVFLVIGVACFELYLFKTKGISSAIIISLTALLISSPWWWYNYSVFGSLMPQSGIAESGALPGMINLHVATFVLADIFTIFFVMPNYAFPVWFHIVWFIAVVPTISAIIWKFSLKAYSKTFYRLSPLLPYFFFCAILIIIYIFYFDAAHMIARFFHPFRILCIVLASCALPGIFNAIKELSKTGPVFSVTYVYLFAFCVLGYTGYKYTSFFFKTYVSDFYRAGEWALQHSIGRIGMQQSGTAGYIASNVVNLDGKVNFAALEAKRHADIGTYIESERLEYLADMHNFVEPLVEFAAKYGGKFQEVDSTGSFIIFERIK